MNAIDKIELREETKAMFRSAASWMRAFAIFLIIVLSILAIALLIISADRNGEIIRTMTQSTDNQIADLIVEMFGLIFVGVLLFVVVFGYAATRLLAAANSFTAISHNPTRESVVKGFKNLRQYWFYYMLCMAGGAIFGIIIIIKVASVVYGTQG